MNDDKCDCWASIPEYVQVVVDLIDTAINNFVDRMGIDNVILAVVLKVVE